MPKKNNSTTTEADLKEFIVKNFPSALKKLNKDSTLFDCLWDLLSKLHNYEAGRKPVPIPIEKTLQMRVGRTDPRDNFIIAEIGAASLDLVNVHFDKIKETMMEKDAGMKATVALSFKLDESGPFPKVKSTIQFSAKWKDSRESTMSDPNQVDFPLDGEGEEKNSEPTMAVARRTSVDVPAIVSRDDEDEAP